MKRNSKAASDSHDVLYCGELRGISDIELLYALVNRDDVKHVWYAPFGDSGSLSYLNNATVQRPYVSPDSIKAIDLKPILVKKAQSLKNESIGYDLLSYLAKAVRKEADEKGLEDVIVSDFNGMLITKLVDPFYDAFIQDIFKNAWPVNDALQSCRNGDKVFLSSLRKEFEQELKNHHAGSHANEMQLFIPSDVVHDFAEAKIWMDKNHLTEAIVKPRNGIGGRGIAKLYIKDDSLHIRYETREAQLNPETKEVVWDGILDEPVLDLPKYRAKLEALLDVQDGEEIDIADDETNKALFIDGALEGFKKMFDDGMVIQPCMDVSKGDLRVIMAGGTVIGAYNRIPVNHENGEQKQLANVAAGATRKEPEYAEGWAYDESKADLGFTDMLRLSALAKMLAKEPYHQNLVMVDMLSDNNGRRYISEINNGYSVSMGFLCRPGEKHEFKGSAMGAANVAAEQLMNCYRQQHLQWPVRGQSV